MDGRQTDRQKERETDRQRCIIVFMELRFIVLDVAL